MQQPGSIGNVAPPTSEMDAMRRRIADLERRFAESLTARSGEYMTIGKGGIRSANFDGTLDPPTAGSTGWGLSGGNGNAIFNDLVLRGRIIGDDALASLLRAEVYFETAGGYAIDPSTAGTATVRAEALVTVPDGFSQVSIFAAVQDSGWNRSGAADYLNSCVLFGTSGTDFVYGPSDTIPDGDSGNSVIVTTAQFSGLSGGDVIHVQSRPFTTLATWIAASTNSTVISLLALFLR